MPRVDHSQFRFFHRIGPNFIDGVAFVAALFWFVVIVLGGFSSGVSPLAAIKRGLTVSIVVYSIVYIGVYLIAWAALMADQKKRAEARRRRIEALYEKPREQRPEPSQKQG